MDFFKGFGVVFFLFFCICTIRCQLYQPKTFRVAPRTSRWYGNNSNRKSDLVKSIPNNAPRVKAHKNPDVNKFLTISENDKNSKIMQLDLSDVAMAFFKNYHDKFCKHSDALTGLIGLAQFETLQFYLSSNLTCIFPRQGLVKPDEQVFNFASVVTLHLFANDSEAPVLTFLRDVRFKECDTNASGVTTRGYYVDDALAPNGGKFVVHFEECI